VSLSNFNLFSYILEESEGRTDSREGKEKETKEPREKEIKEPREKEKGRFRLSSTNNSKKPKGMLLLFRFKYY
jgi:hypothetical protein